MIYAYAIDPKVASTWGDKNNFRFFIDKFGLGTPRILFEIPKFTKWRSNVLKNAIANNLSELDKHRLTAIIQCLNKCRYKNIDMEYDGNMEWLINAEKEYKQKNIEGIITNKNPRNHKAVIKEDEIGLAINHIWDKPAVVMPKRSPSGITNKLESMILLCNYLFIIDPHFGPENKRYINVFKKIFRKIKKRKYYPEIVQVHCNDKIERNYFIKKINELAIFIPKDFNVEFYQWSKRVCGEKFHNRYILTDHGGVILGTGLDEGSVEETDDIHLMNPEQYEKRKKQFCLTNSEFDLVNKQPIIVTGKM